MKYSTVALIFCTALASCGGGSSSSGPPAATSLELQSQINNPSNAEGQDSLDMASIWDDFVTQGYQREGILTSYARRNLSSISITLTPGKLDSTGKKTPFIVKHVGHNAKQGDLVTLSGINTDVSGISPVHFNTSFEIKPVSMDTYEILVDAAASSSMGVETTASLTYTYQECRGTQLFDQSKLIKEEALQKFKIDGQEVEKLVSTIHFDFKEATKVVQTVVTKLEGCSPALSQFETVRYFPYQPRQDGGPKYPLIGQSIKNGDYSVVESFSLPPVQLKSKDKGEVAWISNYANSTRQTRTGKSKIRYEILNHTAQSVFVTFITENYDGNNFKYSEIIDYYGKASSSLGAPYSLIRTVAKYNNPNQTLMVIDYPALSPAK